MKGRIVAILCAGLLSACASQRGMNRTSELVHQRLDVRVERTSPLDLAEIRGQVAELLREPLDVDAAAQIALMQNPGLQARFEELQVARGDLLSARRIPNPELDFNARFPVDGGEPDLDVGFLVDLAGTLRTRLEARMASDVLRAEELSAAGEALALVYRARSAFFEHQADVGLVALMTSATMTFRAAWETAQALREAGNVTELDVAQEHAAYEESRLTLAQAELRALESREALHVVMGLSGDATQWTLASALSPPTESLHVPDDLESRVVEANLSLLAQRAQMDAMARGLDLARSRSVLPALHAGVVAERSDGAWEVGPVFEMTLPLFDQGQGRRMSAEARRRRAQHQALQIAVEVRSGARRTRNRLLNARERVRFFDDTLLPARQAVMERTLLQYNAMGAGVFQLLAARRAVIDTMRGRLEAVRDLWLARAALEQALAGQVVLAMDWVEVGSGAASGGDGGGH